MSAGFLRVIKFPTPDVSECGVFPLPCRVKVAQGSRGSSPEEMGCRLRHSLSFPPDSVAYFVHLPCRQFLLKTSFISSRLSIRPGTWPGRPLRSGVRCTSLRLPPAATIPRPEGPCAFGRHFRRRKGGHVAQHNLETGKIAAHPGGVVTAHGEDHPQLQVVVPSSSRSSPRL